MAYCFLFCFCFDNEYCSLFLFSWLFVHWIYSAARRTQFICFSFVKINQNTKRIRRDEIWRRTNWFPTIERKYYNFYLSTKRGANVLCCSIRCALTPIKIVIINNSPKHCRMCRTTTRVYREKKTVHDFVTWNVSCATNWRALVNRC